MCTLEKKGNLYILTLTDPNSEHRLNPTLISAIRSSLSQIKSEISQSKSPPPSALITTAEGKFFSNGYDLKYAETSFPNPLAAKITMDAQFRALISDLISLPLPTIAAVTGHASAAGMILAVAHDYVVMRRERGFMYMSEVDIGLIIPAWFVKVVERRTRMVKEVVMRAEKVAAERAVEMGLVDVTAEGVVGTLEKAKQVAQQLVKRKWKGEIYAENRKVFMKEVLESMGCVEGMEIDGRVRLKSNL